MKLKRITTTLLLIFVAVSVAYLAVKEIPSKTDNANPEIAQAGPSPLGVTPASTRTHDKAQPDVPARRVVAYYFHGNFRCQTCRKIEAYCREAVENGFPEDIKAGRLEWHVVNVEEPGNEHFIQDYKLFSKALVLVAKQGSRQAQWKNLQKIWTLVRDKGAFTEYVQAEIRVYLRGN